MATEIERLSSSIDRLSDNFSASINRVHDRLDVMDKSQRTTDIEVARHHANNEIHHGAPCEPFTKHLEDLDKRWARMPAWLSLGWALGSGVVIIACKFFKVFSS